MEATSIRSIIESVTVYRQGARIHRAAELLFDGKTCPKSVRFPGLPLYLEDDSVRARIEPLERPADDAGEGVADPPVVVDIRIALEAPEPDPALRPAEDAALTRTRRQVAELVAVEKQIVDELGRLDRLELVARPAGADGDPPRSSPTSSRLELVAFRERHEQKLREESIEIRDRLASARREVEKLEDQNRRASTARQAREHETPRHLHHSHPRHPRARRRQPERGLSDE